MSEPMSKAEIVVPSIANVKIAPKLRKKYFYISKNSIKFRINDGISRILHHLIELQYIPIKCRIDLSILVLNNLNEIETHPFE